MSYVIGGREKLRGFENKVFSTLKTEKNRSTPMWRVEQVA
jgi:hypothetical protein